MNKQMTRSLIALIPVFVMALVLPFAIKRVSNRQEKLNTNSEASSSSGTTNMTLVPLTASVQPGAGVVLPVTVQLNIANTPGNLGISGAKFILTISNTAAFSVTPADVTGLLTGFWNYQPAEVVTNGTTQTITLDGIYLTTTGFISASPVNFATINLHPGNVVAPVSSALTFDLASEIRAKSGNGDILLSNFSNGNYSVVLPTPTPTVTPTATPVPPSPTPTRTPTPVPPTPTPTPTPSLNITSYTFSPTNPTTSATPNISFTAAVGGTATGSIQYQFDCNNTGPYDFTTTTTVNPFTTAAICNYTAAGSYPTRVTITRQGVSATASNTVVVVTPPTPTPTLTPTATPVPPTPTSTVTPTPTRTPTPVPPTVTPTQAPANVNFSIAFQGINPANTTVNVKTVTVELVQSGTVTYTCSGVTVTANAAAGLFSGSLGSSPACTNISAGLYDVYVKGPVHLRRRVAAVPVFLNPGVNTFNWSATPLLIGDISGNDNRLELVDVTALIGQWTQSKTPSNTLNAKYDVDDNGFIELADVTWVLANWTASIITGD